MFGVKFSALAEKWWDELSPQMGEKARYNSRLILDAHLLPYFGDHSVSKITADYINGFVAQEQVRGSARRHPTGLAASTICWHLKLLNKIFRWAESAEIIKRNPMIGVVWPTIEPREIQVFTPGEVAALISVARPKWLGDMILLAFRTGMRRGEMFGLQWDDIDFQRHFLSVRRSIGATSPHNIYVKTPKTKRSIRRVDLDNATMKMFERRRDALVPGLWVFEQKGRDIPSPWYTAKYMHDACITAGIPPRGMHTLRHTHATQLLIAGIHPKIVQERLGHSNIMMTLDTYSHVIPTMQSTAIDVFNGIGT